MAKAEQIKSLIQFHLRGEKGRFLTTALQVAAYEARKGHSVLAQEIRSIIDEQKESQVKVFPLKKDLNDFISLINSKNRLADIVLEQDIKNRVENIIREYFQRNKLQKYGLSNRKKILLVGPPGTGKTMTASVLAGELNLPFYTVQMDKIITKFMGETGAKLRQVFEVIQSYEGVFLFDEFDSIASERGRDDDVGEMRRVLNALLQFIENNNSKSIIIAATNNMRLLDKALFRRFDDILNYGLPSEDEIVRLIESRLVNFKGKLKAKSISREAKGLSHAEITQACYDSIKEAILANHSVISKKNLVTMLKNRKSFYHCE